MADDQTQDLGNQAPEEVVEQTPAPEVEPTPVEPKPGDDWKQTTTVPYSRMEEVVRKNQQLEEQLKQVQVAPQQEPMAQDDWNALASTAKDWNDFFSKAEERIFANREARERSMREEEERKFNAEVKTLYTSGLVKTKDDENAVIKFAVDKGKELGTPIPLSVAARWFNETQPKENPAKEVNKNIQSSQRSNGTPRDGFSYQRDIRGKSLDDIAFEAKERAPKQ